MKRVVCVLENGFEEIEAITPVTLLRRAGVEVVIAGVSGLDVTGKSGVWLRADALLGDVAGGYFDALFLPGGPAVRELRKNKSVIDMISRFHSEGKTVAAICAAPLLLQDAGIMKGKRFTAHFTTSDELPENTAERLVIDGDLITARGAGTAFEFGLALVEILVGKAISQEVSAAVMA